MTTVDPASERCIIGSSNKYVEKEHLERYYYVLKNINFKDKTVLDIACGSGYGTKIIAQKAKLVYGIDKSASAIKFAVRQYPKRNINFLRGDATNLPFKNNSLDIVISFETLEHISNYSKFIAEISRILKKKGLLIISTPNKRYTLKDKFGKPRNRFHFFEFNYEELSHLLKKYSSELKILGQYHVGKFFGAPYLMRRIIPPFLKNYLTKNISFNIEKTNFDKVIFENNVKECKFFIAICKKDKS